MKLSLNGDNGTRSEEETTEAALTDTGSSDPKRVFPSPRGCLCQRLSVYTFVGLFVSKIAQNIMNGF